MENTEELIHDFIKQAKHITPKSQDAIAEYIAMCLHPVIKVEQSPFIDKLLSRDVE